MDNFETFTAFAGQRLIAQGDLARVALAVHDHADAMALIFDDATGRQRELDMRGTREEALARLSTPPGPPAGRGRPKLGVTAREVTLLPRHWEWLASQPGGASSTLRRLVEDARRSSGSLDGARQAQEALYRVMSVLAGDLPRFEDATRALYAKDDAAFDAIVGDWPADIAAYVDRMASAERGLRSN